ncbi:MAG TPA: hypothetical protein VNM69_20370 [Bacillus sp. (in: firmicutes)]|uniref:DUF6954 family protein n=1 Tax=Bacillus litorisediminis TaxID=2922713 RepID=UPI001FAE7217|nr:hypothetical protein [Bacillus litorisediminis]HWO78229.1 hypothetical protein [Bacillus sp. (in: firmicutes)]
MKKWWLWLLFVPVYLLITYFGLGPVLLADGTAGERILTLFVVLGIYAVVTWIFLYLRKW